MYEQHIEHHHENYDTHRDAYPEVDHTASPHDVSTPRHEHSGHHQGHKQEAQHAHPIEHKHVQLLDMKNIVRFGKVADKVGKAVVKVQDVDVGEFAGEAWETFEDVATEQLDMLVGLFD